MKKPKKDELDNKLIQFILNTGLTASQDNYVETGNPIYVWEAVRLCSVEKLDYPEWVKEYLYQTAVNLGAIRGGVGNDKALHKEILSAIGMIKGKGGASFIKSREINKKIREAVTEISALRQMHYTPESKDQCERNILKIQESQLSEKDEKFYIDWLKDRFERKTMKEILNEVAEKYNRDYTTVRGWWYKYKNM